MKITLQEERSIIIEILTRMEVTLEDAEIVADVTLDADLKGFSSHGIGRFPQYIKGLKYGTIKPNSVIEIENETRILFIKELVNSEIFLLNLNE